MNQSECQIGQPPLRERGAFSSRSGFLLALAAAVLLAGCAVPSKSGQSPVYSFDPLLNQAWEENTRMEEGKFSRDPRAYFAYLLALKAEENNQFEEAATHYQTILTYDPSEERFYKQRAIFLLRSGQIDPILPLCEEALKQFPTNLDLIQIYADVLAAKGKNREAQEYYAKAMALDPNSPRPQLLQGVLLEEMGEYPRARNIYERLVLLDPGNPLAYYYLARAMIRIDRLEEAQRNLTKSVALRPNFLQARSLLAWTLEKLNRKDEALKEYEVVYKLDPANKEVQERIAALHADPLSRPKASLDEVLVVMDVHTQIGALYFEQAIFDKALDEFQLVLARNFDKEVALVVSRIYETLDRLDKAIEIFESLRQRTAPSVPILLYSARLYNLNDQTQEAINLLSQAVKLEPDNESLYHSLALGYLQLNQVGPAIEMMQKAVKILIENKIGGSKEIASYNFELGAMLERASRIDEAVESMKRAIDLDPLHSNAHNFLGYIYALRGEHLDKAELHLKKALSIQPRNGYFLDSLGWIYHQQGEHEKALQEIKKALVYTPPDPVLYSHLGDIQFSLKNYPLAVKAWKTSLSLTRAKKDEVGGELPDAVELEEKIRRTGKMIQQRL